MHLGISVRSHRASEHAAWVDAVLTGRSKDARLHMDHEAFPVVLVRQLDEARRWLRGTTLGSRRFGLVASSGCARLRPYGIEVSAGFRKELDYAEWFTASRGDLRSSFALETSATEFECQGADSDDCGRGFRLNAATRSDRRRPPVPTKAAGVWLPA
jgi:hypothetical protein